MTIELIVTDRSGLTARVNTRVGISLMEALRDNGVDELLARCGGCCSCATCHVFIVQGPEGAKVVDNSEEDDLLDSSDHRQVNSRLSCQLVLSEEHDGLAVHIAPDA